ncbi:hypothetical protein U27_00727 [Candidatus Vecturithrix granuli]|uniref:Uncharacterized protein n=1 Tax=Vecturithrix granuli TaxID=1499967 RepID=A0A081C8C4_VECG1|nr:hypothetical protein U27_00727 [Candidatus Vecturithrix granuli]
MSTTLYVKADQHQTAILQLVKSTIDVEITKLELAIEMADKRLEPFENRYHVTSEDFLRRFTAEDLDGGDDEYVCWVGEYRLKQRILEKLHYLRGIENN